MRKAVECGSNDKLKVQLSTALDAKDARAIDVKYHLPCWVQNVQRASATHMEISMASGANSSSETMETITADIEFLTLVKGMLENGKGLSMLHL